MYGARRLLLNAVAAALLFPCLTLPAAARDLAIGIAQYPRLLHPSLDSMLATTYVLGMTHRSLTVYDAGWQLACMLCTELPTLANGRAVVEPVPADQGDGSGRGMAVRYTLDERARWGDGTPVTARDVLFTWEVGRHPDTAYAAAEGFRRIRAIDVVDERTVVFHHDRVSFQYAALGDFRLLPEHLERAAFAEPAKYRERTLYVTAPTTPGLWNGPYRVAAVTPGAAVDLVRNEHWAGPPPAFGRITVKAVENTAALEATLLAGGVDYVAGEIGFAVDQALAFEKRHGDRFTVLYHPALFYEHLDVRLDNPVLADRRVRQALLHAIDRRQLSEALFGGKVPVADSAISPLDGVTHPGTPHYAYDPARAAALLEEAGFVPGRDGVRVNAGGQRLSFDLQTTAGDRSRERVQQVIQAQWKAVGAEARIRNEPARVLFGDTLDKRKFAGLVQFAWIASPENPPRSTLHCDEIPSEANGWSGQNYTGYCNPEMDRLIEAINTELDDTARKALWAQVQTLYATDLPALPLYFRAEPYILPRWLSGVRPTGHLNPSTLWIEEWRVAD